MLKTIQQSWGWTGLNPSSVSATNDFGNLIVQSTGNEYWRLCPEALSCEVIARSVQDLEAIWADGGFQQDWKMTRLAGMATAKLGPVNDRLCYCLKVPAALGGQYDEGNLGMISRTELIAVSGDLARQIKNLPDGSRVRIKTTRYPQQ